jgi:hypothetical protein
VGTGEGLRDGLALGDVEIVGETVGSYVAPLTSDVSTGPSGSPPACATPLKDTVPRAMIIITTPTMKTGGIFVRDSGLRACRSLPGWALGLVTLRF